MEVAVEENTDQTSRLSSFLGNQVDILCRELEKLHKNISRFPFGEVENLLSCLPSTGGRPAYNISKSQIKHLGETGLSLCKIAEFLGVSKRTLQTRRIDFIFGETFSEISDNDFTQVREILHLTPYSCESYVMF